MLVAAACTTPAHTDTASLPPAPVTTVPPTTSPAPAPSTTTSTVLKAGPDVIAWLGPEAAVQTLLEAVEAWEGVAAISLVTSEEALVEFASLFADRPDLEEGVMATALPESLRIELSHPSFAGGVAARLRSLSDIDDVVTAVTPACNPFPGWNVVVFVADDRDLTRLRNELAAADGITDISVIGRDEALAEYLGRFAGVSDLASGIAVKDMSVSLRARTTNPVTLSFVADRFEGDAAVKGIQIFNPGAPACR